MKEIEHQIRMISKTFFYKGLFVLLIIVSMLSNSFEAVIALSLLMLGMLLMSKRTMLSTTFFYILIPLSLIIILSIIVGLFYNNLVFINFLKDFLYLIKPILFLVIGYLVSQKIDDKISFLKIIIYTAAFSAGYHIFRFIVYFFQTDSFNMHNMRSSIGLDNFLELFALAIIISKSKYHDFNIKYLRLITIILSISFVLYFSRTMVALIIVVSLAFLGYLRLSKKGLKYISIGLVCLIAFYTYLFSIDIPRNSKKTVDNFLYKIKLAPAEIFVPQKSFDVKDHAKLWDHWRAYEANKAIGQLNEKGFLGWSVGLGAGSLVDLGFYAPLSNDKKGMRYISNIHNGYVFVLYKTGILGILLYLTFLLGNYLAYKKYKYKNPFLANMIYGIVLFYLATTLVITGIYNLADIIALILGGILFLNHKEA